MTFPLILKQAITPDFQQYVLEFVKTNDHKFVSNPCGNFRRFISHIEDEEFNKQRSYLADQFEIKNYEPDHMFGMFLGQISAGGFVHRHTDKYRINFTMVRLNVLISKPESGGLPYVSDQEFDVDERDCWACIASNYPHGTSIVKGNKPRILLSIGLKLPNAEATRLIQSHENWLNSVSL